VITKGVLRGELLGGAVHLLRRVLMLAERALLEMGLACSFVLEWTLVLVGQPSVA